MKLLPWAWVWMNAKQTLTVKASLHGYRLAHHMLNAELLSYVLFSANKSSSVYFAIVSLC